METPRIRAGFVQSTLAALEAPLRDRVQARLRPETRDALARSGRLAWLPVEVDVELTHAIYAELGAGRAREVFRRNLSAALESPILRSFAQGALRLFGPSPERIFGWGARAWTQIYRDAGAMAFASDAPGSGRIELTGLPRPIAESREYLDGVAGAIAAGFDWMSRKGEVTIERLDPGGGRVCFRLCWEEEDEPLESLPEPVGA